MGKLNFLNNVNFSSSILAPIYHDVMQLLKMCTEGQGSAVRIHNEQNPFSFPFFANFETLLFNWIYKTKIDARPLHLRLCYLSPFTLTVLKQSLNHHVQPTNNSVCCHMLVINHSLVLSVYNYVPFLIVTIPTLHPPAII